MSYEIKTDGPSRSFPEGDPFLGAAAQGGDVLVCLGGASAMDAGRTAIAVELGTRYLADFTGLDAESAPANMVGFNRFRNGEEPPSPLIELVRGPATSQAALDAARAVFEAAGLTVAVCTDQPGRIVDRLLRPKWNAALRFLDEGLSTQADMDMTCRMGLGYPAGPVEAAMKGGLADHHDVTKALFDTFGTPAYAPPRAAIVAARKRDGDA